MDLLHITLSICMGLVTTWLCVYLLKPAAIHIGLVDEPGGRKKHANTVPLIGGIAIFIGFSFALFCLNVSLGAYRGLFVGGGILVLLGVMDDFHELTPRIRLIGQCVASLLLIQWGNTSLNHLGNLFFLGPINLGLWSVIVTVFLVLAFINAINMIDGCDGLAGLTTLGQALFLICYCVVFHKTEAAILLVVFSAVICMFLMFNMPLPWRKHASIFMGDAGSMFVGFLIIWFALYLSQVFLSQRTPVIGYNLMTILWVLAYPLYDLTSVILHRLCARHSPFMSSRDHLHCLLMDLSVSRNEVTFILFGLSILLGLFGFFLANLHTHEFWQLLIFIAGFGIYFLATVMLKKQSESDCETLMHNREQNA